MSEAKRNELAAPTGSTFDDQRCTNGAKWCPVHQKDCEVHYWKMPDGKCSCESCPIIGEKDLPLPPVLDVCCGTRMMWFDKQDPRALFVDKRSESFRPTGVKFADKDIEVKPDVQADFKALPFPDDSFALVVFDPPHIVRESLLGNVTKYYGALPVDWKTELQQGFTECFRVLKPGGTLIFKWCESEIPVGDILKLTPHLPLFGHRTGKAAKTHWCAFLKPNTRIS